MSPATPRSIALAYARTARNTRVLEPLKVTDPPPNQQLQGEPAVTFDANLGTSRIDSATFAGKTNAVLRFFALL